MNDGTRSGNGASSGDEVLDNREQLSGLGTKMVVNSYKLTTCSPRTLPPVALRLTPWPMPEGAKALIIIWQLSSRHFPVALPRLKWRILISRLYPI